MRTLTPARLRYCRWFHLAGWPLDEIVELFEVSPRLLKRELMAV
jgi:hypothetical protein